MVKSQECRQVHQEAVAGHHPLVIAKEQKHGFAVPIDWLVNADFREYGEGDQPDSLRLARQPIGIVNE